MRECTWKKMKKAVCFAATEIPRIMINDNEKSLLAAIQRNEVFGFIVADVTTPDHIREEFGSFLFPPIVRRMVLNEDHLSNYMKQVCLEENKKTEFNTLVQTYNCVQELLMTKLVKMYLDRGLIVKNVTKFIQYTAGRGKLYRDAYKI